MTIGLFQDRPDRVRACTARHVGACSVCGFDGVHDIRAQVLERGRFRGACGCAWYGPIRRHEHAALIDASVHRLNLPR